MEHVTTSTHNLPQSLAASLDIEELERRLELVTEAEAMEYAESQGWEVSGEVTVGPDGAEVQVEASKTW